MYWSHTPRAYPECCARTNSSPPTGTRDRALCGEIEVHLWCVLHRDDADGVELRSYRFRRVRGLMRASPRPRQKNNKRGSGREWHCAVHPVLLIPGADSYFFGFGGLASLDFLRNSSTRSG
jgi:hypothetical protein